ncbi:4Fe-4S binding protein [Tenuifilum thalassicum]|uniref:4Fe-4S binding protein n=1 Tax=Tenuifilum thalassicum TaxID=2590900 RepID=A0A7D4AWB9_9BACT|nr:4Fe-4S binding protein [Tenuifilum thalassicum]QKG79254.1 4Fe-4S binding protein [Tenuifilum thalassicum]
MLNKFNKLLDKNYFPIVLKYFSLAALVMLVVLGFSASSSDPVFLKQLRNTNLGNLIVWSYWWPAIIILAIFFGRVWCMVCPVELITTAFSKIGLKRKRPRWLLSGWIITVFYLLILFVGIQVFAIHRNPTFMALYLLTIVAISVLVGAIFEKNTFCRYVCPVGYLLGLYSKLSFLGWRVKDKGICDSCTDKSCISKNYQYNLNVKSCGVDLYPANISDNSNCILCGGCLKACSRYQTQKNVNRPNPQLTYTGFANDLFKLKPLKLPEMVFVLVISGFVISEIWSEWKVTDSILNFLPHLLLKHLALSPTANGLFSGIILFGLIPLLIWYLPYLIAKISGFTLKLKNYLLNYGLAFIPIIASAHLSKAILKTTSRLPYFKYLSSDITGKITANQIVAGDIILNPTPVWLNILISVLLTLVVIGGIWLSVAVVKRLNYRFNIKYSSNAMFLIPIVYGGIFLFMILAWRWIF